MKPIFTDPIYSAWPKSSKVNTRPGDTEPGFFESLYPDPEIIHGNLKAKADHQERLVLDFLFNGVTNG